MSVYGKDIYKELKAAAESKITREPKNAQERKWVEGGGGFLNVLNNCNRIDQVLISR